MRSWEQVREALLNQPRVSPAEFGGVTATGVYAWYDEGGALLPYYPSDLPIVDHKLPLYVGLAAKDPLSSRIVGTHLVITRRSALRRTLAALLRDELDLLQSVVPAPKGKYDLLPEYETRLTKWIEQNLRVTAVNHEAPALVERPVIQSLLSPLNFTYATGSPYRQRMAVLRRSLRADAHVLSPPQARFPS